MNRLSIVLGLLAVLLAGCSSVGVDYDFDQGADFTRYQTYRWLEVRADETDEATQIVSLADRRIRDAVERELELKGFRKSPGKADLIVAYTASVRDQARVYDSGYYHPHRYGYRRAYWSTGTVHVYEYQEGTLIVDLIDSLQNQVVWRGKASGVVGESGIDQVDDAVSKIFSNYPPESR